MRAKEFIVENGFNWSDYEHISVKDRLVIIEAYYANNGNLFESNTKEYSEYFSELVKSLAHATKGNRYIMCYLALVNDTIIPVEPIIVGLVRDVIDDEYIVEISTGVKSFPINYTWKSALSHTFCFDNEEDYNRFRTAIKLKFTKDLPTV